MKSGVALQCELIGHGEAGEEGIDRGGTGSVAIRGEDAFEERNAFEEARGFEQGLELFAKETSGLGGVKGEVAEVGDGGVDVAGLVAGCFSFILRLALLAELFFLRGRSSGAEIGSAHLEAGGAVIEQGLARNGIIDVGKQGGDFAGGIAPGLCIGETTLDLSAINFVVEKGSRLGEEFAKGLRSLAFEKGIGVIAGWQADDTDVNAFVRELAKGFDRRFVAGFVGIEAEESCVGVAFEDFRVLWGAGGALRGDGVIDAVFVAGDCVELTFADENGLLGHDRAAGAIKGEKDFALGEKGCFGGVEVFSRIGINDELTTGEGDDITLLVRDGEHQAIAKADVEAALFALDGDAGIDEFAAGEIFLASPVEKHFLIIGHPADGPADGHFSSVATGL